MSSAPETNAANVGVDDIVTPPVPPEVENPVFNQLEEASLNNLALRQLIQGRGDWGTRIFWIMIGWLTSVIACLVFQGFHIFGFNLSDAVIIAFITTTTINVLGLGHIVARHFFQHK
jgi:hypothetical protein